METISVKLNYNKIKNFYCKETNITLTPLDRRKIKKLKRKNLLLECGKCGPFWSPDPKERDCYKWRWKIFIADEQPISSVTVTSPNRMTSPSHKKSINKNFKTFDILNVKQHNDNLLHSSSMKDVHEICNTLYIVFKDKQSLIKWKLSN